MEANKPGRKARTMTILDTKATSFEPIRTSSTYGSWLVWVDITREVNGHTYTTSDAKYFWIKKDAAAYLTKYWR